MTQEKPIRLFLLRHGNTFESDQIPLQVGCKTDLSLTQKGREQALDFVAYLKKHNVQLSAIYAGGLKRQIETAQLIARNHHGIAMHLHTEALTEIDYGCWEGLSSDEIAGRWPDEYLAWSERFIWQDAIFGKSASWHWHHLEAWVETIRETYQGGEALLGVTSNGMMRFFRNVKVGTGRFCELHLYKNRIDIQHLKIIQWNTCP